MASLFGSVATEVGGTIKDIAVDKRDDRRIDEEAQREMQLQKQRMQHDSGLLDRRLSGDARRAARREEFEGTMFDRETDRRADEAELGHTRTMEVETYRGETDIAQEYIKQYYSRSAQKSLSGNGWKVEFERDQVIDPTSPSGFRTEEYIDAQGPGGQPWKIEGEHAFFGGETNPQAYDFGGDIGQKRAAEKGLYDGEITAEEFKDAYGYIPSGYIFGQVSREDTGLQNAMQRDGVRMPVWMLGSDDRRRRPSDATTGRTSDDVPGPAAGGASANSASAELRALAEKEGRDPTPEETDEILRKYREREGLGEYPRGVQPGDMNSPYQGDFEGAGEPTEFGQRVLDSSSGALSRAAADEAVADDAGEAAPEAAPAAEDVEADEVEAAPAAPVSTGPSLEEATAGEITGEIASSIADSVASAMMGGHSAALDTYMTGREQKYYNTLDDAEKAEFLKKLKEQKAFTIDSPVPRNWKSE